jgi:hypothetical protein
MILDLVKYFAKFPERDAVLSRFARDAEKYSGYDTLKSDITAMPSALLPEITGFVTGTNDEWLYNQLQSFDSYWMLLEFGRMPMRKNNSGVRVGTMDVHLTIGFPVSGLNIDMYEEAIIHQHTLDLMNQVIAQMRNDDAENCYFGRLLEEDYELMPIEPVVMAGSVGWSVSFKRKIDAE